MSDKVVFDYQDPLDLAMLIKNVLATKDGHKYVLYSTSNPGKKQERNVIFTQRIYRNDGKNNGLGTFIGYLSYRACEALFCRVNEKTPKFSSIEFLEPGYVHGTYKLHFLPNKLEQDLPNIMQEAKLKWDGKGDFAQYAGKIALKEFIKTLTGIIDAI